MGISFSHKGDFSKTTKFFKRGLSGTAFKIVDNLAKLGVEALSANTPKESGTTSSSWDYEIKSNSKETTISWTNSNINDGVPIAIILQYGHGTGTGGYVAGTDYINPAMEPVFDMIAEAVWKEVIKL